MTLLLYLLISLQLRMSFEIEVHSTPSPSGSTCALTYFWLDILVNFRTAYFDAHGDFVINQRKIAVAYLKSWFIIDFLTCLPISYIMVAIHGVDAAGGGQAGTIVKILRLLKLAAAARDPSDAHARALPAPATRLLQATGEFCWR